MSEKNRTDGKEIEVSSLGKPFVLVFCLWLLDCGKFLFLPFFYFM